MLIVPYEAIRREFRVSNSRFIVELSRAGSVDEARSFIAGMRAEFPDATHCVPAFVIGGGNAVTDFCSDDGEPSGTAGRPLLAVLKGSGLGNAAVAVVRYFGGTLLGTGGLVKAYSDAGRLVVAAARRAEVSPGFRVRYEIPYHLFDRARMAAAGCGAIVGREDFGVVVTVVADVPETGRAELAARLAELGSGSIEIATLESIAMMRPLP